MSSAQEIDVSEIAPAGVGRAALNSGDDLFRVHHGDRVAGDRDVAAE